MTTFTNPDAVGMDPKKLEQVQQLFTPRSSAVSIRAPAWPCTAMAIWCWTSTVVSPTSETVAE